MKMRADDPRANALCEAIRAGHVDAAGAEIDWVGHDGLTPLDTAIRSDAHELAEWLHSRGAHHASSA